MKNHEVPLQSNSKIIDDNSAATNQRCVLKNAAINNKFFKVKNNILYNLFTGKPANEHEIKQYNNSIISACHSVKKVSQVMKKSDAKKSKHKNKIMNHKSDSKKSSIFKRLIHKR